MPKDNKEDKDMIKDKIRIDQKTLVQKAIKMGMKQNDGLLKKLSKN